jgi:hypothetical protein
VNDRDLGAPASGTGSHATHEAPDGSSPVGFDPSRITLAMCEPLPSCAHDFAAWRDHEDGRGGELFCTRCGLGAMAHSLSLDW